MGSEMCIRDSFERNERVPGLPALAVQAGPPSQTTSRPLKASSTRAGAALRAPPTGAMAARVAPAALGPKLSGLDLAMLGDDAWDDAFMTIMFDFERPVPELEAILRAWLLAQLADPSNLLRLRIRKGPDGRWRYFANDEPSEALCARMLTASPAPLRVDEMPAKLRAPNADAMWARVAPLSLIHI